MRQESTLSVTIFPDANMHQVRNDLIEAQIRPVTERMFARILCSRSNNDRAVQVGHLEYIHMKHEMQNSGRRTLP